MIDFLLAELPLIYGQDAGFQNESTARHSRLPIRNDSGLDKRGFEDGLQKPACGLLVFRNSDIKQDPESRANHRGEFFGAKDDDADWSQPADSVFHRRQKFGRMGAFVAYESMDSLYRKLYSEAAYARTWPHWALGMSYGLDMEWIPGSDFWTRHRFKWAALFNWRKIYVAGMLSGFMDEGVTSILGVHWISDEAIVAFAECDFRYLDVGANFRWKFVEIGSSYRFPNFAVAVQLSFNGSHYGVSYARGFKHNSIGWNGVHVSRWLKNERRKIN